MAEALVHPEVLSQLIVELEGANAPVKVRDGLALISRSTDDPAMRRLWLIPSKPERIAGDFAGWAKTRLTHLAQSGHITLEAVSQVSVITAGAAPAEVKRAPRERIRLISAVTYLWADKLGCADSQGGIDTKKAEGLIVQLTAPWDPADEQHYVQPSIRRVEGPSEPDDLGDLDQLKANRPVVSPGTGYVLYGPGGIGKTHFLRRLSSRLARATRDDKTQSLSAFCPLPALLHADALETWLSRRALGRMPLPAIRALIRFGVIIPLLDALDELVRGQAREGSVQFLRALGGYVGGRASFVLSCRDYYLNVDPLVPEHLRSDDVREYSFGHFSDQGRRSFIQARLGLTPEVAGRWSQALERQATATLGEWREVDSLIGHPLFMDAFCAYVAEIPRDRLAKEAENFRFSTPDVFAQIVDRVLEREVEKAVAWTGEFGKRLQSPWDTAFAPGLQRRVLLEVVLRVARDGAELTDERIAEDPRYKELIHGLYGFSSAAEDLEGEAPQEQLSSLVEAAIGRAEPVPSLTKEKAEEAVQEARARAAAFFAQHTLANTEPDRPPDLIFALRHRAYFDYFLAEEIVDRITNAITDGSATGREEFIAWCDRHNLFGRYRSAFDFLLWQSRVVADGARELRRLGAPGAQTDDVLLSYVSTLGLDLLLRRSGQMSAIISDLLLAPSDESELLLVSDLLPPVVSGLHVVRCQFPRLVVNGIGLKALTASGCDFDTLALEGAHVADSRFEDSQVRRLRIRDEVVLSGSLLDLECLEGVDVNDSSRLSIIACTISPTLREGIDLAFAGREHLLTERDVVVLPVESDQDSRSKGRRFLDKLVQLVRKDGREEWAVYAYKLRGRSVATDDTFDSAIAVLQEHGIASRSGDMIFLTSKAESGLYDGKGRPGRAGYDQFRELWDPIVGDLDRALGVLPEHRPTR